jgi:hypothetical protein
MRYFGQIVSAIFKTLDHYTFYNFIYLPGAVVLNQSFVANLNLMVGVKKTHEML